MFCLKKQFSTNNSILLWWDVARVACVILLITTFYLTIYWTDPQPSLSLSSEQLKTVTDRNDSQPTTPVSQPSLSLSSEHVDTRKDRNDRQSTKSAQQPSVSLSSEQLETGTQRNDSKLTTTDPQPSLSLSPEQLKTVTDRNDTQSTTPGQQPSGPLSSERLETMTNRDDSELTTPVPQPSLSLSSEQLKAVTNRNYSQRTMTVPQPSVSLSSEQVETRNNRNDSQPTIPTPTERENFMNNSNSEPIHLSYLEDVHVSQAASVLPTNGTLFCWVMTSPKYHDSRVGAVNDTWIHRCDHGQFFTNQTMHNESIPYTTVFSELSDRYEDLFVKTRVAFYYIWKFISRRFDWYLINLYKICWRTTDSSKMPEAYCSDAYTAYAIISTAYLKADDDTYVIVENLREYLKHYDPEKPYFMGFRMKPYLEHGYNSGGAGYLLSRGALGIYFDRVHIKGEACEHNTYEDLGMAKCVSQIWVLTVHWNNFTDVPYNFAMKVSPTFLLVSVMAPEFILRCLAKMGIFPHDTRDDKGSQRFNAYRAQEISSGQVDGGWVMDPMLKGLEAFSPETISFHHLSPEVMKFMEVLLYRVRIPNKT